MVPISSHSTGPTSPTTSCLSSRSAGPNRAAISVATVRSALGDPDRKHARDVGVGLCERRTGLQSGDAHVHVDIVRHQLCRLEALREDDVGLGVQEPERPWHDANHFARPRIDRHDASDDGRIAGESPLPVAVTQDRGLGGARRIVLP